jgi:hypothetical protein
MRILSNNLLFKDQYYVKKIIFYNLHDKKPSQAYRKSIQKGWTSRATR